METWKEMTGTDSCEICGERFRGRPAGRGADEVAEFWNAQTEDGVVAHAECGMNAGMALA